MDTGISVAVAIVTYGNRSGLLVQVLQGVFSQTAGDQILRVVVCDNGASQETKSLLVGLADREHKMHIVTLNENMGSAIGYREAIRAAAAFGCKYVWCLDDDNLPAPDALEKLIRALDMVEPQATLLSLRDDREEYLLRARAVPVEKAFCRKYSFLGFSVLDLPRKIWGRAFKNGGNVAARQLVADVPLEVPYAPFGGLFFSTEILSKVGLPESDFYLYGDDHEFTARFVKLGYPIYLVAGSHIEDLEKSWHISHPTDSRWRAKRLLLDGEEGNLARLFYSVRNRVFLEVNIWGWRRSHIYIINAFIYLLLLYVQVLTLRFRGKHLSCVSATVVLRATAAGWRGRLGKVEAIV
ncbi:MAG: glycosyltransferase [Clostridia bacterium]|nr:MAG: glycosyltransferase [Clostridia bacterium]